MNYLNGKEAIEAAIKSIAGRGKKLDNDIQRAALSAIHHHHENGDYDLINSLVAAMPKGSRVNALREFIDAYGGVSYNAESKAFEHNKAKRDAALYAVEIESGEMKHWTEFKPEPEYKPIDFPAQLARLLKQAEERMGTDKGDNIPADLVKKVRTAIAAEVTH